MDISGRLALRDSLNTIIAVARHSRNSRNGVDRSWAQMLLRFYHCSNSAKLRLVIFYGIRNTVLLLHCHKGTLGNLVLPVLLLSSSSEVVLLFTVCRSSLGFRSLGHLPNEIPDLVIALRIEPIQPSCPSHTNYIEGRIV